MDTNRDHEEATLEVERHLRGTVFAVFLSPLSSMLRALPSRRSKQSPIAKAVPRHDSGQQGSRDGPGTPLKSIAAWLAFARWSGLGLMALVLSACVGNEHMSFLNPQGPVAYHQAAHFYWVLGIMTVFVAGPIFVALPLFLWRYRLGNKAAKYTPRWRDSKPLVAFTWFGPIMIVCALGYFVWRDSHRLNPYTLLASDKPPLQMQVIGYDWKWLFIYPKQGIATIGAMALPVGRPVTIHLTSATVMQSLFIPALGSQIYAMGGMVTRLNLQASHPGRYLGENTMYDGNGFHQQKFTAVGMRPAAFKAWVAKVKATGVPLDAQIFKLIGERNTHAQLFAALPPAAVHDGAIYFTGVSPNLFPTVVKATMRGDTPTLAHGAAPASETAVATIGKPAMQASEAKP